MAGQPYIGTSGFAYDHWKEVFYPADVAKRRWLEYYCEHFDTVEINSLLVAPKRPGSYRLQWDVVEEGVCWFSERASAPPPVEAVWVVSDPVSDPRWWALLSLLAAAAAVAVVGGGSRRWAGFFSTTSFPRECPSTTSS